MSPPDSFGRFAEQLPFAVLLVAPDGEVAAANAEARRGLSGERNGWNLLDRVEDPEGLRRYLALCSGGDARLPGALRLRGDGGEAPWRCDGYGVRSGSAGAPGYVLLTLRSRPQTSEQFTLLNDQIDRLHREVRRREEMESELESALEMERRARNEAEEANRLKDEFLATISHELRTPLHAILGWIHVLRHRQDDREALDRGLEIIERNADLQAQLVDDVLDVSRIITGRLRLSIQRIDLYEMVQDTVETVRPAAEAKNIRLDVVVDSAEVPLQGDYQRLVQVVWNLLSNAIKFTPKGGRIRVVLQRAGSRVEVAVSDTGLGIAPEFLPYVFDRFRQADGSPTRQHGGLGLGLSIVRHLVELHGGMVFAESEGEGEGATFTVSLPVPLVDASKGESAVGDGADVAESREATSRHDDGALRGLRLLLAEDHQDSLDVLCHILDRVGVEVRGVRSSSEALEAFEAERPDLVISDIEMPGEDGYTLIRKMRDLEQRTDTDLVPAIAVTAHADRTHRLRALRAGFQSFVAKPVDPDELLAVIASLTGRH